MTGIIVRGVGGFYEVRQADGSAITCKAGGRFRKMGMKPMVGDRVELEPDGEMGFIVEIHPRKNAMVRPPVANVDQAVVVISAGNPPPDYELADKLLVMGEMLGIELAVCINKCDEGAADGGDYALAGYPVFRTSAKTGEGLDALKEQLKGKVSFLAGQSGVGKSSILNQLLLGAELETGRVNEKLGRGRHTTRKAELLLSPEGFYVADTPGFSLLSLETMEPERLKEFYPEFAPYEGKCRFLGCNHGKEPDCAVAAAAEAGDISPARLARYRKLLNEIGEMWRNRYG